MQDAQKIIHRFPEAILQTPKVDGEVPPSRELGNEEKHTPNEAYESEDGLEELKPRTKPELVSAHGDKSTVHRQDRGGP